ncbi:hypothetical protein D3C87_1085020 [compost metagenome]
MPSQTLSGTQLSLTALQESDQAAFEHLLSTMLKSGIDPSAFSYATPTVDPVDGNYANTLVKVAREKANVSLWPYSAQQSIRYRRIGMPAMKTRFGGTIRADLPTTTRKLMEIFLTSNGLYDRSAQFVDAPVSAVGNVTITCNAGQFLLYGATSFAVKPKQRQLVDVIKDTTIPGFRVLSDFTPVAKTRLMDQMTADNTANLPYPLEPAMTTFGNPTKISGYRYDNTSIKATAAGDGYYLGTVDLIYTRYDFGWSTNGAQFLVTGPSVPTIAYMVAQVALQTGFPITAADVNAQTYPSVPSGQVDTLTITFKDTNLRYTGELTIDYKAN